MIFTRFCFLPDMSIMMTVPSSYNESDPEAESMEDSVSSGVLSLGDIYLTLMSVAIILATVLGNILVITAVCVERRLRKVSE